MLPHAGVGGGDAAAASAVGNNRLNARVDYLEFLGSFWRVSLTCAALGGVALTADLSSNAMRRMRIEAGARVDLELPAERVLVFPRGRGA